MSVCSHPPANSPRETTGVIAGQGFIATLKHDADIIREVTQECGGLTVEARG